MDFPQGQVAPGTEKGGLFCQAQPRLQVQSGLGVLGPSFTKVHLWRQLASDYKPRHVLTQSSTCWPAWLPSYKMEPEFAAWSASLSPKELRGMRDGRFPEVILNRRPFTRMKSCDVSGKNPPWTRMPPGASLPPAQPHRERATNARMGFTVPQQAFLHPSRQIHVPAPVHTPVWTQAARGGRSPGGQGQEG